MIVFCILPICKQKVPMECQVKVLTNTEIWR